MTTIIGIKVYSRIQNSNQLQKILSEYGCNIKTRLGLHDIPDNFCSESGIIILEFTGEKHSLESFLNSLQKVHDIKTDTLHL